jgi:hypothetical protein
MLAVIPVDNPVVFAFRDVFEEGDEWEQIVGCEACTRRGKCCGRCKLKMPSGDCRLHVEDAGQKPHHCVITPNPTQVWSWCAIQFKCIKGSRKGEIKKVSGENS